MTTIDTVGFDREIMPQRWLVIAAHRDQRPTRCFLRCVTRLGLYACHFRMNTYIERAGRVDSIRSRSTNCWELATRGVLSEMLSYSSYAYISKDFDSGLYVLSSSIKIDIKPQ